MKQLLIWFFLAQPNYVAPQNEPQSYWFEFPNKAQCEETRKAVDKAFPKLYVSEMCVVAPCDKSEEECNESRIIHDYRITPPKKGDV